MSLLGRHENCGNKGAQQESIVQHSCSSVSKTNTGFQFVQCFLQVIMKGWCKNLYLTGCITLIGYIKSGINYVGSTMLPRTGFCGISNYTEPFPFLGIGTLHNAISRAHQLFNCNVAI